MADLQPRNSSRQCLGLAAVADIAATGLNMPMKLPIFILTLLINYVTRNISQEYP